jgi:hypothetical protein
VLTLAWCAASCGATAATNATGVGREATRGGGGGSLAERRLATQHLASKRSQKKLARADARREDGVQAAAAAKRRQCEAHDATLVGEDCVAKAWMDMKLGAVDKEAPLRDHLKAQAAGRDRPGLGRPVAGKAAPLPASLVGAHPSQLLANLLVCGEYQAAWTGDPCAETGDLLTPRGDPRAQGRFNGKKDHGKDHAAASTKGSSVQWQAYLCGPVPGRLLGFRPFHPAASAALGRFTHGGDGEGGAPLPLRARGLACLRSKRYLVVGDSWARQLAVSLVDAIKPAPRLGPFAPGGDVPLDGAHQPEPLAHDPVLRLLRLPRLADAEPLLSQDLAP